MYTVKAPKSEPIPGYRLVEPLGKGGFGEVWKCEAPGGLLKAVKFIRSGLDNTDPQGFAAKLELRALQRIKSIRHPFLLSIERIEVIEGEVLIVMELADRSLQDLLNQRRHAGETGIPRKELLGYLREAAEALDVLNQEHGLQHLDIKPRNLFLIGRHVKVADFGLVASLSDLQNQVSWERRSEVLTPLYAAPETFLGSLSHFSDQYSLAITYQELLTDTFPLSGQSFSQLAMRHIQAPPELHPLPEADRPIVARALAKQPSERFPSCSEFVQALTLACEGLAVRPAQAPGTQADLNLGDLAITPNNNNRQVPIVSRAAPARPVRAADESNNFLSGYQLLECINRHNAGEMWKAQRSDGRKKLVRIINGYDPSEEHPGGDPLARLRELRHPALPRYEIQTGLGGRLALVCDAPDGGLVERLRECQQMGQTGIPRADLLGYLRQVAEALDDLYEDYRLQHLSLSPRQLMIRGGLMSVLDFALLELFWLPAGYDPAALNTRYAAPELFDRQITRQADQYSLALIYQELLTGIHAFRNYNQRQMALARQRGKPDLGMLPATDRPLVAQALHIDPDQRFPSCIALVDALAQVGEERGAGASCRRTHVEMATLPFLATRDKQENRGRALELPWDCSLLEMKEILAEQVAAAAENATMHVRGALRFRIRSLQPDEQAATDKRRKDSSLPILEHSGHGRIVPATLPLKVAAFGHEWRAQRIKTPQGSKSPRDEESEVASWVYRIDLGGNLWQRYCSRTPGLLVQIQLQTAPTRSEGIQEVLVQMRPSECKPDKGREILEKLGPNILQSVRDHLQLAPDRRGEDRVPWVRSVRVRPLFRESEIGDAIAAQTRDLNNGGAGLELPCRVSSEFLLMELNLPQRASLSLPLQVIRSQPLGDGRYLLGCRFAWQLVVDSRS